MAERKRYSAEEKSAIVLEILQEGKKVSEVAEEHGISPNQILLWKKQALENMAELFRIERRDITAKKEQREISELKSQIAHKDSVIAELADENMGLKKKYFGLKSPK
jgi:transposase-like protein